MRQPMTIITHRRVNYSRNLFISHLFNYKAPLPLGPASVCYRTLGEGYGYATIELCSIESRFVMNKTQTARQDRKTVQITDTLRKE